MKIIENNALPIDGFLDVVHFQCTHLDLVDPLRRFGFGFVELFGAGIGIDRVGHRLFDGIITRRLAGPSGARLLRHLPVQLVAAAAAATAAAARCQRLRNLLLWLLLLKFFFALRHRFFRLRQALQVPVDT